MKYKITQGALHDLEKIWLYTFETWSIKQADRYFNLIMHEIEYLSENPQYGKDYDQVRKGYFRSKVKSHLLFYKIDVKRDRLEVIRILHQNMDIDAQLND